MCGGLQATWHQHQAPPTNIAWVGNISGNVVTGRSQIIIGWYHLAMASIRQQCCQINWWLPHRIYHHWNLRYRVGGLEMYNFCKFYNSWPHQGCFNSEHCYRMFWYWSNRFSNVDHPGNLYIIDFSPFLTSWKKPSDHISSKIIAANWKVFLCTNPKQITPWERNIAASWRAFVCNEWPQNTSQERNIAASWIAFVCNGWSQRENYCCKFSAHIFALNLARTLQITFQEHCFLII